MTMQMSTGAKIKIMQQGFIPTFTDATLYLFSNSAPIHPDAGISEVNQIVAKAGVNALAWAAGTTAGHGISWQPPDADGIVVPTDVTQIEANGVTDGIARWFWIIENAPLSNDLTASKVIARIQGVAAVGGGDLRLSSAEFTVGSRSSADGIRIYFK